MSNATEMKNYFLGLAICFTFSNVYSQNANTLIRPHSFNSAATLNGVSSAQPGSIAYRSDLGQMFYRNNSSWVQFGSGASSSSGWGLSGNALNGDINKFLGTTDNSEFRFRSNNTDRLIIMPSPSNRHRVLFPKVVYFPNSNLNNSAVLGINGNQGRLRITAGNDDTFNNTQGACIDLHANNAEQPYSGRLDLVAGSNASGSAITFWSGSGLAATITSDGIFAINTSTPPSGMRLVVNGYAAKSGGGAWTNLSDRRVKKNVVPYTKGIDKILKIRPVNYQYAEKSGVSDLEESFVGVIAQEMEEVLPSTVRIVNDSLNSGYDDLRMFNASEILFTLINAVKELDQKNKALREENAENRRLIKSLTKSIKNN
ncbi:tail fiber domain-containing protein [Flavobacteriales bacterium]|nr:tail fiber domain-containing protein [Flavobacteriales bacterium]